MVTRGVRTFTDLFDRAQAFTTTPGVNGWTIEDTSSGGTPTYLCVTEEGGAAKLTLANTSEAEIVTLYHNDVLTIDIDRLSYVKFVAKVAGIDSATTLSFGVGSAQADDEDTMTVCAWFKMEGSASTTAIVVESDDGTTDRNDIGTGQTLAAVYKTFEIDFRNKSDVKFYIEGQRVASGTTFNMSAYTGQLQPFVQLEKASGTGVPSISIALVEWQQNYAYGA